MQNWFRAITTIVLLGFFLVALAQDVKYDKLFNGELTADDSQLESKEYFDEYSVRLKKGQEVSFVMTSEQIKSYLFVEGPDGKQYDVGDYSEDEASLGSTTRLTLPVVKSGKFLITATSVNIGEQGSYSIGVSIADKVYSDFSKGSLSAEDKSFDDGSYFDVTEFNFEEGERVTISVMSSGDEDNGFDTYLLVNTPDGQSLENDDYPEGNSNLSRIEFIALKTGTYVVRVSSYEAGETGDYVLAVGRKKP